jgi:hypothetical protein
MLKQYTYIYLSKGVPRWIIFKKNRGHTYPKYDNRFIVNYVTICVMNVLFSLKYNSNHNDSGFNEDRHKTERLIKIILNYNILIYFYDILSKIITFKLNFLFYGLMECHSLVSCCLARALLVLDLDLIQLTMLISVYVKISVYEYLMNY